MRKSSALLLLVGLAACDLSAAPETVNDSPEFPLRANWSATLAPVGTGTVRGTVAIAEYLGSRFEVTASITGGSPNRAYQWRIFRGDCALTTAAANNTDPNGLLLVATIQAYPDLATSAAGSANLSRMLAGALDSLTAYSVRVRVAQSAPNWNGTSPVACGNLARS